MTERLAFIVFVLVSSLLQNPIVIIVAGLTLAVVILVTALFLFRNSGKKKGAKANKQSGTPDWQRQGQQAWNQPGMGGPSDNWGQQQQQPGAWGGQAPSQQPQPGAWGGQTPSQQPQPGAWGGQTPAQQPGANVWGAQGGQTPAQQPQPGVWGGQTPSQQPQPGAWGSPTPNTPSAGAGLGGGQPAWDATFMPQQSAAQAQDPWAQPQPQAAPLQQGASVWGGGMQSNSPAQPQTGYGSGQSWGQSGQPAQAGQSAQSMPPNDSWGQPPAQQAPAWAQPPLQQASSTPPAASGNAALPSWQQQVPGQGQGFGAPAPGAGSFGNPGAGALFGSSDNDRTMLRPGGPQGSLGVVRVEEGKEPGRVYEVRKEELSIGRSRESDIFLEDLAVSRLHAKIVSLGNGNYALKDEGSANGTKVNGQLVNKYQTHPLQEGDKIQLGQTVLVFARK